MTYGELELRPLTLIKFNYDGPDLSTSGDAAAPRLTFLDGPRWLFPHLWQGWWSEPHQNRNLWEDGNVSWQRFRLDMIRMHILEPHWTAKRLQIVLINLISNKCSPGVPRYNPPGEKGVPFMQWMWPWTAHLLWQPMRMVARHESLMLQGEMLLELVITCHHWWFHLQTYLTLFWSELWMNGVEMFWHVCN